MIERIGNCKIIEEVGAGGMAVVYKAIQEPLGRIVGIKALKSAIAIETQFAKRFEREAQFMASLQQENIINVYDFIKYGGTMFIVMEYVEGIDLYDLLDKHKALPPQIAAIITLQVARALNHAHFRGIVHRDIKPANVMISKKGDVKLMDFGIARDETLSDLTETGTGLGTPSYMSPEQILGEKLDPRTDIWSLGVVFYQMLTGKKPFVEDANRSVLQKIRIDRYTPARKLNSKIPRVLERILGKCLEKQPADRFGSIQSLIHELEDFLATRLSVNYNLYIVKFLSEINFISKEDASGVLAAGEGKEGYKSFRENKRTLKTMGFLQASILSFFIFAAVIIQLTAKEPAFSPGKLEVSSSPLELGYLRVVAIPWAKILINNKDMGTTPIATPIALPPGNHFIELVNPYFESKRLEIQIEPGKTIMLNEKLALDSQSAKIKE